MKPSIKGVRKLLTKDTGAALARVTSTPLSKPSLVGETLINKALPSRQRLQETVGNLGKEFLTNPRKAFADGLARDRLANATMEAATGLDRVGASGKLFNAVYKGGGKDLAVNVGGLGGSIGGRLLGGAVGPIASVSGLAGDLVGAAAARRALNDTEALAGAYSGVASKRRFQELTAAKKAELVRRRAAKAAKQTNAGMSMSGELGDDVIGWGIGNGAAIAGQLAGVGIPLQGAAVAMPGVPAMRAGYRRVREVASSPNFKPLAAIKEGAIEGAKTFEDRANPRKIMGRSRAKRRDIRENINTQLQELPDIPEGVVFNTGARYVHFVGQDFG
jgi:hypothetical protein